MSGWIDYCTSNLFVLDGFIMSLKDDVEQLKEQATYKRGFNDGAFFVGKKMLLVCSAVISIATAGIYHAASTVYNHFDKIKVAVEAINAK